MVALSKCPPKPQDVQTTIYPTCTIVEALPKMTKNEKDRSKPEPETTIVNKLVNSTSQYNFYVRSIIKDMLSFSIQMLLLKTPREREKFS